MSHADRQTSCYKAHTKYDTPSKMTKYIPSSNVTRPTVHLHGLLTDRYRYFRYFTFLFVFSFFPVFFICSCHTSAFERIHYKYLISYHTNVEQLRSCDERRCRSAKPPTVCLYRISQYSTVSSLRTAFSGDLYVPRTRRRFGDRAFAVAAPRVWNSLPTDIKLHRSTTTSFKRRLKTVLFNRGFAEYM